MKQLCILLAACTLSLTPQQGNSTGHCYKAIPIEGNETNGKSLDPVCYSLEKNLNEFCDEPPVVCGMKISPKYANELSLPVWTPVDFGSTLNFVEKIVRSQWAKYPGGELELWNLARPALEEALNEGRLSVSTARFDLFRLGTPFQFYRIDAGDCSKKNMQLQPKDRKSWKLKTIAPNIQIVPAPGEIKAPMFELMGGLHGDVFFFKEKVYFSYMNGRRRDDSSVAKYPYDNVITVKQGDNQFVKSKDQILFGKDVCDLKYNAETGK